MTQYVRRQKVDPTLNNAFSVWTEPAWLPFGMCSFESVSGLNLGSTEVVKYKEGNDKFYRLLLGATTFDRVSFKKGVDVSRYTWDWRMAAMETNPAAYGSGRERPAESLTNPRATLYVATHDRNDPSVIVVKFALHGAIPPKLHFGELKAGNGEPWEETLEVEFEWPEVLDPKPWR